MTAHEMKEFSFVRYSFLKPKRMIPDACCFLKIKLQRAAMKDFWCFSESLCDRLRQLKGQLKELKLEYKIYVCGTLARIYLFI